MTAAEAKILTADFNRDMNKLDNPLVKEYLNVVFNEVKMRANNGYTSANLNKPQFVTHTRVRKTLEDLGYQVKWPKDDDYINNNIIISW